MKHYTTIYIYDETDDSETPVPVVVEYRETAWREIEIDAIRADMPGEPGPDISDTLDSDLIAEIEGEIIRGTSWSKHGRPTYYGSDV